MMTDQPVIKVLYLLDFPHDLVEQGIRHGGVSTSSPRPRAPDRHVSPDLLRCGQSVRGRRTPSVLGM